MKKRIVKNRRKQEELSLFDVLVEVRRVEERLSEKIDANTKAIEGNTRDIRSNTAAIDENTYDVQSVKVAAQKTSQSVQANAISQQHTEKRLVERMDALERTLVVRMDALEEDLTATMMDTVKIRRHVGMATGEE